MHLLQSSDVLKHGDCFPELCYRQRDIKFILDRKYKVMLHDADNCLLDSNSSELLNSSHDGMKMIMAIFGAHEVFRLFKVKLY